MGLSDIAVPIVSFAAGSAIPLLSNKYLYDGISIRINLYRAMRFDYLRAPEDYWILHTAAVKMLNTTEKPIALEGITIRGFQHGDERYRLSTMECGLITESLEIPIPLSDEPAEKHVPLPAAIRPNIPLNMVCQSVWEQQIRQPNGSWRHESAGADSVNTFGDQIDQEGLEYQIQINGKLRRYKHKLGKQNYVVGGYKFVGRLAPAPDRIVGTPERQRVHDKQSQRSPRRIAGSRHRKRE